MIKRKTLEKLERSLKQDFFKAIEDNFAFEIEDTYKKYVDFYFRASQTRLNNPLDFGLDVLKKYDLWKNKDERQIHN